MAMTTCPWCRERWESPNPSRILRGRWLLRLCPSCFACHESPAESELPDLSADQLTRTGLRARETHRKLQVQLGLRADRARARGGRICVTSGLQSVSSSCATSSA